MMFFFHFLELTSCALNISLRNHGNHYKRKEGGLWEAVDSRQMAYENLGGH